METLNNENQIDLSLDSEEREIKILTKDNITINVKENEVKDCTFFKSIFLTNDVEENHFIDLEGESLQLCLDFLKHQSNLKQKMKQIKKPVSKPKFEETIMEDDTVLDEWYSTFINSLTPNQITKLIYTSNYLMIDDLIQLLSAKLATVIMPYDKEEDIVKCLEQYRIGC